MPDPSKILNHDTNLEFSVGGGPMGAVLRGFDWSQTSLGPLESWPQSLRTATSMMLNARHPMYLAWGDDLLLLYNNGYRDILGAKAAHPQDVLGKPFREVWAEVWDQVGPMLDVTMNGESVWFEDLPFTVTRNGFPEQMHASFSTSPIRGENGRIAGVLCICNETTAKVRSERERDDALIALETNVEKLWLAADGAGLGTFDCHMPSDIVICDERMRLHFGLPATGAISTAMLGSALHPDDRERVIAETRMLVASPTVDGRYRMEYRTVAADGQVRWIATRGRILHATGSSPMRLIGTTIDITERRLVEERLRLLDVIGEATRAATDAKAIMETSTRLLGQYLDATRVAYADLEPDNDRFTIRHDWCANDAISTVGVYSLDLFGSRAASDMRVGRTLLINDVDNELPPGDGRSMFNRIGVKAIICCPLVRQNRLVAMMAVHQRHPRNWTPDEVALVEAVVDRCWAHIERVRAMEALREADRRKSEFLATLAHELRNPLAPLRTGLELLRIGGDNRSLIEKVRGTMERQVGQMVHLINDLLDIARISNGKVVLKIDRVDLQTVIASAVETSLPLIEAAGHTLTLTTPSAPLWMDIDAVRISQVLSNLLSNAAKYTPQNGSIGIEVVAEPTTAIIKVSDTGVGISVDSLDRVFEMFAQASQSIGISKGGLGIGLSLVHHLVALHGGTVTATSSGLGHGSTFVVRLPGVSSATPMPTDVVPSPTPETAGTPPLRVLVADDNVDAADTLSLLLRAKGHEVHIAYDGLQAIEVATRCLPDLAFVDIGMPKMDGYQVASKLRAFPLMARMRLIALTGWGAPADRERSRKAGFDHHLLKPASPQDVDAVLSAVTQSWHSQ